MTELGRLDFARRLLEVLGAPATELNLRFLLGWMARENTTAAWNPLATTQPAPGATMFNSVGVRNYPDEATGVQATVTTLRNGFYPNILDALANGRGDLAAEASLDLRRWSGGGYSSIRLAELPADTATTPPAPIEEDDMPASPAQDAAADAARQLAQVQAVRELYAMARNEEFTPDKGEIWQAAEVLAGRQTVAGLAAALSDEKP